MKYICFSLILLFLYTVNAWAQEYAYVTDSLQLRVYAGPSTDSEFLQSIDSGDSVEVFDTQDGFSKVTTYDGTVGWVKSAFLVEDPPAKLLYYSVGEKNKQLEAEIESLKNNPQIEDNSVSDSVTSDADANLITELQTALDQQQKVNQSLQQQLAENKITPSESSTSVSSSNVISEQTFKNNKILFIASGLALIAGIFLGLKISYWRMRKRLHGFRI